MIVSSADSSLNRLQFAEPEIAPEAKELDLQTLLEYFAKNFRLCTKARRLKESADTLGRKGREIVVLT